MGIPNLTSEQIETLCEIAEKTARKHILSKIPIHRVSDIDITIDIEGQKPINVNLDLEITLSLPIKDHDIQKLVNEAKEKAFLAIEEYLREI